MAPFRCQLERACRADDVRAIAEKYGEVRDVYIPRDFFTKRPKGLAFVEFTEASDCQAACDDMEGMEVEGQPVRSASSQSISAQHGLCLLPLSCCWCSFG